MNDTNKPGDPEKADQQPPEPPICKLYNWWYEPTMQVLYAERYEDHPTLGNGPKRFGDIFKSGTVTYLDKHLGLAQTARASYILVGPDRKVQS